ncbi:3-deoxy-manno-octulosonate cytidylyltransferase,3-deoxy-manno-octulosonate cytidylyltransferase,Spore coat polysaccharide biosynthesis protein, predicted glycosyltransferase,3-deoxy-D-manno-octulosonate cytidylyltransferase,Cytidylyltransferase [Chlamydia serpentis]|uniref:3-deoxy-manno-octulosonate cytidylyltransferase n=1 Tax=Chlamydia serpentis TaxID=1967782 RepID=A0A2R8FAF6_9CHLA|nr:3-deoxy-manno-octulosonate cytidylyltransferase [Chlamydia serpentis]SPN73384.1 3-deoxy-manno-octulosonate cytidylyltransferase,3-deoxy-manno-octulosonate cytidylyltransferase,Spore coat polysaccharide biosynthesis protein, predicted glycosyltransferase,3-deoxy-D-manno-octulosonate cytidylyltransferase,Cytidylyltransferase [Chlamydia serpentis]
MNQQKTDCLSIGVLPARWNSSRFPGKPLANIFGKSLIQRTYENISQCTLLDRVIVATDDQRIIDHVNDFGGYAVMTSSTCPNGTERTGEVAMNYFPEAEIIVNIQGDEPCLNPEVVDCLVRKLKGCPEAELTTPVAITTDIEEILTEKKVKCVFDIEGRALYFSRSAIPYNLKQETPVYLHIGVYAFKRKALLRYLQYSSTPLSNAEDLEQLRFLEHGEKIHVCIVDAKSPSVDYPEDIAKVEKYISCLSNAYF